MKDKKEIQKNKTKTIYLIRHGQTEGNVQGAWLGAHSKDKLNQYGKKQARSTAHALLEAGISASKIFASPTPRTLQHAEILQKHLHLPIERIHSLSEINLGILEDRSREEGMRLVPDKIKDWDSNVRNFFPPLGESAVQAAERFYEILELVAKNDINPDILIVSHGVVIKLFLARILNASLEKGEISLEVPKTTHGSITVIKYDGKYFKFVRVIENKFPDSKEVIDFG